MFEPSLTPYTGLYTLPGLRDISSKLPSNSWKYYTISLLSTILPIAEDKLFYRYHESDQQSIGTIRNCLAKKYGIESAKILIITGGTELKDDICINILQHKDVDMKLHAVIL